jgi:hypothetical protein
VEVPSWNLPVGAEESHEILNNKSGNIRELIIVRRFSHRGEDLKSRKVQDVFRT